MERQIIRPESEAEWLDLRTKDITSTEVAALFGCSPYMTLFELWHRKRDGKVVEISQNERMKWGTRLQAAIAYGIAEDSGWKVRPMTEYIRLPSERIGSSFDFEYEIDAKKGILEVKNVDAMAYRDGWLVDGDKVEAPLHIEFQAQHQLYVSGQQESHIGALVGGNTVSLLRRVPDLKVISAIKKRVAEFWESIEAGDEPSPTWEKDAGYIISRCGFSEPGKVFDATNNQDMRDMVDEYAALGRIIKSSEQEREIIKAKILTEIGDAEKVVSPHFTISAGMVGPAHVEFDRAGYRGFRVFSKKQVKEN